MKQKSFIRSVFGWTLLLLFTLSITPRQLLHDVLADHTDFSGKPGSTHAPVLFKKGFSCERLNLVAESPFASAEKFADEIKVQPCTDFIVASFHSYSFKFITLPALRGPPSI